jgi:hypothetical protein
MPASQHCKAFDDSEVLMGSNYDTDDQQTVSPTAIQGLPVSTQ